MVVAYAFVNAYERGFVNNIMHLLDINNSTIFVVFAILFIVVLSIGFILYWMGIFLRIISSNTKLWKKILYFLICIFLGIVIASLKYEITGKGLLE